MKKNTKILQEAYNKNKNLELESLVEHVLTETVSLSQLMESPEQLSELSYKIAEFEQLATASKKLTPKFSKLINENCKNILESINDPTLLKNSLNGLAVASEILKEGKPSFEFCCSTKAARGLTIEFLDQFSEVCEELSKLNENQLEAFKNFTPNIKPVFTDKQIKEEVENFIFDNKFIFEAANLDQLARALDQLESVIDRLGGSFKGTRAAFDKFHQDFENFATDSKGGEKAQANLIAQTNLIIGMFNTFGRIWPNFVRVFRNHFAKLSGIPSSDVEVIEELKDSREKIRKGLKDQLSFKDGWISKIARKFPGVKYPNSLNPDVVINDILNILSISDNKQQKNLTESLETLNSLMGALSKTTTSIAPPAEAQKPQETSTEQQNQTASQQMQRKEENVPMQQSQPSPDPLKLLGQGILSLADTKQKTKAIRALTNALGDVKLTANSLKDLSNEIAKIYKQKFDELNKTEQPTSQQPQTQSPPQAQAEE